MPVTNDFGGGKFFVKINDKTHASMMFIVLILIETTDLVFAVDSIPAVLAISQDPFIAYTSNIMAILGLRALYFAIAGVMKYFRFLNYGLAVLLAYVGIKMLLYHYVHIPIVISLLVIGVVIGTSILISVIYKKKEDKELSE